MYLLLFRKLKSLYKKYDWFSIITVLLTLHVLSAGLLLFVDYDTFAQETLAKTLWKGTWWFFVTATTVGYGDIVPHTIAGQAIAIFDMIFGIGLMATAIGAGADKLIERRRARVRGLKQLNLKNHIVILGGGARKKVDTLLSEIRNDPFHCRTEMVVCSDVYDENPFGDDIEYVRGSIGSDDVIKRSCVQDADYIIIYGYTDEETILTALAVDELNRTAFTTVYIRDRLNIRHIERINKVRVAQRLIDGTHYHRIRVITRLNDLMLAREISNPDLAEGLLSLMDSRQGDTFYSVQAWPGFDKRIGLPSVRKMLRATDAHALLVGIKRDENGSILMNPGEEVEVYQNDQLFVIAGHQPDVDWGPLITQNEL
jgi:voltage-gated potassium channel